MRLCITTAVLLFLTALSSAGEPAGGRFTKSENPGCFDFDTGKVRGTLKLDGKLQGISELVHNDSGLEVTRGDGHTGLLSHYRVFSTGARYTKAARDWPSEPKLMDDGSVEVLFPAAEEHPIEMTAVYRWRGPDTIDLDTIIKPLIEMPKFEMFLSNYFSEGFQGKVYITPSRFTPNEEPSLLSIDYHPLMDSNYLMFPRDREAVITIFDGRWDQPPAPVQWCVTRYMAAPLALRRHAESDVTVLMMTPPADCFAVATPYDRDPPDRVSGHRSMYFSLFGRDVNAGETVQAHTRTIVRRGLSDEEAVALYKAYCGEHN